MLISKTPLRVSFLGGGTDFSPFFRSHGGRVLCCSIDKYIYVIVKRRFDEQIRIGYTHTELVSDVNQIAHELVRESLRMVGIKNQIEISTMADIPSKGSGLGSSSSVTVGLLNALYNYIGQPADNLRLAELACAIEIDVLKKPIGFQDQYAVALGGLREIEFGKDGTVTTLPVRLRDGLQTQFNRKLMLFFTNSCRRSESILAGQMREIGRTETLLLKLKDLAEEGIASLYEGDLDRFGVLIGRSWEIKRLLAPGITSSRIDDLYQRALEAGALGGKIAGAGGGGFLLLYCPEDKQDRVRGALRGLRELPFRIMEFGSQLIFDDRK